MKLHCYGPKQTRQAEKINYVINTTIQTEFNWKHELDTFLLSYKKCLIKETRKKQTSCWRTLRLKQRKVEKTQVKPKIEKLYIK